jgi:hypothetical protein
MCPQAETLGRLRKELKTPTRHPRTVHRRTALLPEGATLAIVATVEIILFLNNVPAIRCANSMLAEPSRCPSASRFEYASYFSALFAQIPLELFAALTEIMRVVFIFEVDAAAQRVKASA